MERYFLVRYANNYFALKDGYDFIKVANNSFTNVVDNIWWDEDDYKTEDMIGQWKIKNK